MNYLKYYTQKAVSLAADLFRSPATELRGEIWEVGFEALPAGGWVRFDYAATGVVIYKALEFEYSLLNIPKDVTTANPEEEIGEVSLIWVPGVGMVVAVLVQPRVDTEGPTTGQV